MKCKHPELSSYEGFSTVRFLFCFFFAFLKGALCLFNRSAYFGSFPYFMFPFLVCSQDWLPEYCCMFITITFNNCSLNLHTCCYSIISYNIIWKNSWYFYWNVLQFIWDSVSMKQSSEYDNENADNFQCKAILLQIGFIVFQI